MEDEYLDWGDERDWLDDEEIEDDVDCPFYFLLND